MLQCSLLIGNTYYFFQFAGDDDISTTDRNIFIGVMTGVAALGFICFFTLLPTPWTAGQVDKDLESPVSALISSFKLFLTPEMLQLTFYFFYMGMELTFWSGVYGPCLGFTESFGKIYKSMPGLHGIMIGVGEIASGLIFGIYGKYTNK